MRNELRAKPDSLGRSERAATGRAAQHPPVSGRSARRAHPTPHARRGPGPGRGARARTAAAPGDRAGPAALAGALGAARLGQDDARVRDPAPDARPLRGDERGALGREGAARGAAGGRGAQAARGTPHDRVHRRDPPLQQGAAGRAAGARRVGRHRADRRHHREPLVRGERGAPVALARRGAEAARQRGARERAAPGARRRPSAGSAALAADVDEDALVVPGGRLPTATPAPRSTCSSWP